MSLLPFFFAALPLPNAGLATFNSNALAMGATCSNNNFGTRHKGLGSWVAAKL